MPLAKARSSDQTRIGPSGLAAITGRPSGETLKAGAGPAPTLNVRITLPALRFQSLTLPSWPLVASRRSGPKATETMGPPCALKVRPARDDELDQTLSEPS